MNFQKLEESKVKWKNSKYSLHNKVEKLACSNWRTYVV